MIHDDVAQKIDSPRPGDVPELPKLMQYYKVYNPVQARSSAEVCLSHFAIGRASGIGCPCWEAELCLPPLFAQLQMARSLLRGQTLGRTFCFRIRKSLRDQDFRSCQTCSNTVCRCSESVIQSLLGPFETGLQHVRGPGWQLRPLSRGTLLYTSYIYRHYKRLGDLP